MNQYIPVPMTAEQNEKPIVFIEDRLMGDPVSHKTTRMGDLEAVFEKEEQRLLLPRETIVYEVDLWQPVPQGTPGGLFFGTTRIQPGKVGNEYFMTRGHFHAQADRCEFYWGIKGEGTLILMDRNRKVRVEKMQPGSLHYIPADTAHRVANTGTSVLSFGACWPSDAGYDYQQIQRNGFSGRVIDADGCPQLKIVN